MNREELEERWACWWEDDDGFNIKEGPRLDNIELFFGDASAEKSEDSKNCKSEDKPEGKDSGKQE